MARGLLNRSLLGRVVLAVIGMAGSLDAAAESWTSIGPLLSGQPFSKTDSNSVDDSSAAPNRRSTRFVALRASETGIDFTNRLDWHHPQGLLFDTGYACGGVAVGDIDGNGLPDLFFVSGLGRNRLYLQHSPWKFTESAIAAGLPGNDQQDLGGDGWGTGAALLDIENDGDLDLYVCNYDAPNALYLNRGDGTFDQRAFEYGLDIVDACLMPSVADYDRDGDLDIYLAVNRYFEEKKFRHRDLFYWRDAVEYLRPAVSSQPLAVAGIGDCVQLLHEQFSHSGDIGRDRGASSLGG